MEGEGPSDKKVCVVTVVIIGHILMIMFSYG